jgi:hypothetical protein
LVLLKDVAPARAREYQRLLAQRGILCRIEHRDAVQTETLPPPTIRGETTEPPPLDDDERAAPLPSLNGAENRTRGLGPILSLGVALCFNPRGVIGRIVSTAPYRATLILAGGTGLVEAGGAMVSEHFRGAGALLLTLLAVLVIAPALGILFVHVRAALLHMAGRLLKGRASARELRVVLAWSEIPLLLGAVVALLQLAEERLAGGAPPFTADPGLPVVLSRTGFGLLQAALGIWALSLLLHTVAEIQGFSLCRSLANIVLAAAIVLGPLAVLGGVLVGTGFLPFR